MLMSLMIVQCWLVSKLFLDKRIAPTYIKQMLPWNNMFTLVGIKLKCLTTSILKKTVRVCGSCDEKK